MRQPSTPRAPDSSRICALRLLPPCRDFVRPKSAGYVKALKTSCSNIVLLMALLDIHHRVYYRAQEICPTQLPSQDPTPNKGCVLSIQTTGARRIITPRPFY